VSALGAGVTYALSTGSKSTAGAVQAEAMGAIGAVAGGAVGELVGSAAGTIGTEAAPEATQQVVTDLEQGDVPLSGVVSLLGAGQWF
jgi:hypothetical protein